MTLYSNEERGAKTSMVAQRATRILDKDTWRCIVQDIEAIVNVYRRMNKIMSLGLADKIRVEALKTLCNGLEGGLNDKPIILADIGAGPGDSIKTIINVCRGVSYIIALDPSSRLLANIEPSMLCERVVAVAEYLPLRPRSITFATAFYAARDFQNLDQAIQEIVRTISRGGIAIGDIFLPDRTLNNIAVKIWVCVFVPLLAIMFATKQWRHYTGLCKSLKGWLSVKKLCNIIKQTDRENTIRTHCREYALGGLGYVVARYN